METELTQEETPQDEVIETTTRVAKKCEHCGTDHFRGTKSRFCSDKCKNAWHRSQPRNARSQDNDDEPAPSAKASAPSSSKLMIQGVPPQAQYIIAHQAREYEKLQREYDNERTERKELKKKYQNLKDELAKTKHDHELQMIENKKPSALEGLASSPLLAELMPHIGPAIGMLAQRMVSGGAAQMSGTDGQLDADAQREIIEINNWYGQLPKEVQTSVYEILNTFSDTKPEQLPNLLLRIKNLLNPHGTTIGRNGTNAATGTY